MIIFPADKAYIGSVDLYYSLLSIEKCNLLDRILVICNKEFFRKWDQPFGNFIVDDFTSVNKLYKKIKTWQVLNNKKIENIISIDDESQFETSHSISSYFNIPFYSEHSTLTASVKYIMKENFLKKQCANK